MTDIDKIAPMEDNTKAFLIEQDMASGVKRTSEDLHWYVIYKHDQLSGVSEYWRHKESRTVFGLQGCGLACTGMGTLALMVWYGPLDCPDLSFERQYGPFIEKFDPVVATTVWERHP